MNDNFKQKSFVEKVKFICSITVKNDGRALDVIFALCLVSIIAFSVFLYRTSTNFYEHLDETMENNMSLNFEITQNEHIRRIENILTQFDEELQEQSTVSEQFQATNSIE